MKIYDAAVIGAGPAGITAVLYLVRSGRSVILFEKLTPGGQVLLTDSLENYPGFPKGVKGWELADAFAAHLEGQPVDRSTATVTAVTGSAGNFTLKTSDGDINARTVIAASGATHRRLGVKDEDRLLGHGVSYCAVCDGNFFRGMPVAVVGGGNSALEESLYLARICSRVYLIHRRDAFRGAAIHEKRVRETGNIELVLSSVVDSLNGDDNLKSVTVRSVTTGEKRDIDVGGIFIFVGNIPNSDCLPEACQRDKGGFLVTDTEMRTTVPGIFAAGDIRSKLCRQVVTAAGDGATAAHAASLLLDELHA